MGEGEGAKDVSDQITDEDQLLGAQQKDQPADAPKVCHLRTTQDDKKLGLFRNWSQT